MKKIITAVLAVTMAVGMLTYSFQSLTRTDSGY